MLSMFKSSKKESFCVPVTLTFQDGHIEKRYCLGNTEQDAWNDFIERLRIWNSVSHYKFSNNTIKFSSITLAEFHWDRREKL